jgi:hypothetical protein
MRLDPIAFAADLLSRETRPNIGWRSVMNDAEKAMR